MAEVDYAFIKDGNVVNVAVFDSPSAEVLAFFKEEYNLDDIIPTNGNPKAMQNGFWDGTNFIPVKPYPSWVLNSSNEWEAPVALPSSGTVEDYYWDEETTSWQAIPERPEGAFYWDSRTKAWEPLF